VWTATDRRFDAPLGRDLVRHEGESQPIAILERRHDANAGDTADHCVAGAQVAQLAAHRAIAGDDDRGVHPLLLHRDPLPLDPHVRFVVGRRIEIGRRAAVEVRQADGDVLAAQHVASERHQVFDQVAQHGVSVRRDAHGQERRLGVGPADGEPQHFEAAAVPDDGVENAVQEAGIDQVSGRFDDLGCHVVWDSSRANRVACES
jgi:hypothetical protein